MAFSFKPSNANTLSVAYGVDNAITNFIIQNISTTDSIQNLEIADQKGRVAQVIAYDKGTTATFTMIGPATLPTNCSVGNAFSIGNDGTVTFSDASGGVTGDGNFIIQSIERACTYNDTAKWNITAQGWPHATVKNYTEAAL